MLKPVLDKALMLIRRAEENMKLKCIWSPCMLHIELHLEYACFEPACEMLVELKRMRKRKVCDS